MSQNPPTSQWNPKGPKAESPSEKLSHPTPSPITWPRTLLRHPPGPHQGRNPNARRACCSCCHGVSGCFRHWARSSAVYAPLVLTSSFPSVFCPFFSSIFTHPISSISTHPIRFTKGGHFQAGEGGQVDSVRFFKEKRKN